MFENIVFRLDFAYTDIIWLVFVVAVGVYFFRYGFRSNWIFTAFAVCFMYFMLRPYTEWIVYSKEKEECSYIMEKVNKELLIRYPSYVVKMRKECIRTGKWG